MSRSLFFSLFFITYASTHSQPAQAQVMSDSVLLEQAFQDKNKVAVDSMLHSWYRQSASKKHGVLENDTIGFVYKVYTRFMKDYIHKRMAGKDGIPVNGKYFFIQDDMHYLFIDSLSFDDLYSYFNGIFRQDGLLYKDSIYTYILKVIAKSHEGGTLKTIDPFYPNLREIFYDDEHDPEPIYIKENNHLKTLVHFLGYKTLKRYFTGYYITNIAELDKRKEFLNNSFNFKSNEFLSYFKNIFTPDVLTILLDQKMHNAMVEYYIGLTGGVYLAFYPLKLINTDSGAPLSQPFFAY